MIALDTNILIYGMIEAQDPRHFLALELIEQLAIAQVIVPLPVFGEFLNACRKRKLMPSDEAQNCCRLWTDVYDCPSAIFPDYVGAARASARYNFQYFDALILVISRRAGATILLSEDMHDGLVIDGLTIVNPFVAGNDAQIAAALG